MYRHGVIISRCIEYGNHAAAALVSYYYYHTFNNVLIIFIDGIKDL